MDPRYIRTEKRLIEAMLVLLKQKPYSKITIEDIVQEADVARKTFYAHFANKDELLWFSLAREFEEITKGTTGLDPHTLLMDGKPLSYPVFLHISEYPLFYQDVLTGSVGEEFLMRLWGYLARQSYDKHAPLREQAPRIGIPPTLIAEMLTGALLGTVRWWLQTNMQATPTEMAYQFSQVMAPGVLQVLGLED